MVHAGLQHGPQMLSLTFSTLVQIQILHLCSRVDVNWMRELITLLVCVYARRTIKSLHAAKEFLTRIELKTETTYRPPRTTSAATLRVTVAPKTPLSFLHFTIFIPKRIFFFWRRHPSHFCPRQLHGAAALALVRAHKETHECLHGVGQG